MWRKDAEMDKSTRRLVAAEKDQELLNFHENLKRTRKLVASGNSDIDGNGTTWSHNPHERSESTSRLVALTSENSESIDGNDTVWPHNLHISIAYVLHIEKVISNMRQRYCRVPGGKMENLGVNTIIRGMFMSVSLRAAGHLGNDYAENLHSIKNQSKRTL